MDLASRLQYCLLLKTIIGNNLEFYFIFMKKERVMKKLMMGMFILLFVVAVSCVGGVKKVEAVPFGDGGAALQKVLDDITVSPNAGDSSVDVLTDYIADSGDSFWQITGAGGSISTFVIELTTAAATNEFGIYDASDSSKQIVLFDGPATSGGWLSSQRTLSIGFDGSVGVNLVDTGIDFAGNNFGFFLRTTTGTLFSDSNLNTGGVDHMAAYQGTDTDTIQIPSFAPGLWTDNEYVLAFEDGVDKDSDFDDLVVMVESVQPVPEPGTVALLGIGLAGLVGVGARRRAKKKAA